MGNVAAAVVVGLFAYGVSLVLFIVALRHVGTARAGAYYLVAPCFGPVLAIVLGEPVTVPLVIERHEHEHTHEAVTHDHWHHHKHEHQQSVAAGTWHRLVHTHEAITHTHEHYPDSRSCTGQRPSVD